MKYHARCAWLVWRLVRCSVLFMLGRGVRRHFGVFLREDARNSTAPAYAITQTKLQLAPSAFHYHHYHRYRKSWSRDIAEQCGYNSHPTNPQPAIRRHARSAVRPGFILVSPQEPPADFSQRINTARTRPWGEKANLGTACHESANGGKNRILQPPRIWTRCTGYCRSANVASIVFFFVLVGVCLDEDQALVPAPTLSHPAKAGYI